MDRTLGESRWYRAAQIPKSDKLASSMLERAFEEK
jgi:hypothetical protein